MSQLDNTVVRTPLYVRICARCGILGWDYSETQHAIARCKTHASICGHPVELTIYRAEKSIALALPDAIGG